ncbi:iron complex outermembrane recepter protein [Solitalea koreensis]|uniref:Iron complex outermembrane recepter protein n=2 Tax=Solitalea koreensis TaxID=543615 RepID=A0A521C9V2_9SPHI|nr:iron complex outermembrane recepter protein [Solitalea koreensis]
MAILLPFMAFAQFTISGKVIDAQSKQTLVVANVAIKNTNWGVQTNSQGYFELKKLKPGKYTLSISFVGYKTEEKEIALDADKNIEIALTKSSFVADEVVVRSTRAANNSATTFKNITKEDLNKQNLGQDLPFLLNQTPSVVVNSDAGNGVGYTGVRIRGSDASRTNLTVNGIPLNDAESQGSYLVNLPDLASSIDNIQIQRGVGTSTNGVGAFGASINVQTNKLNEMPYAEVASSGGSFGTFKNTLMMGSGLIGNFAFDGRLSKNTSDGFVDRASSNLSSYFLSGGFYGKKTLIKLNVFSGNEKTYQAWNGIPEARLNGDVTGMQAYINRNYLSDEEAQNLLNSGSRTYNYFTYKNQTDNYKQSHYQAFFSQALSPVLNLNVGLHFTHGEGYYEEYKADDALSKYGLPDVVIGGDTIKNSNLIRQKWLDNNFYGTVYSLQYSPTKQLGLTLGGAYNEYKGGHYGKVIWAQYASTGSIDRRYYDDDATKKDFNIYWKANYGISSELNAFVDLQYRHVNYSFLGYNQEMINTQQTVALNFFNPKFGLNYKFDEKNSTYLSYAATSKEPGREEYVNSTPESRPKPENLKNIELGFRNQGDKQSVGLNLFWMHYRDQLVLTGKVNDVGEYVRTNTPKSYRTGIEVDGSIQLTKVIKWTANASLSANKIVGFDEYLDNYDDGSQQVHIYKKTDISYSPSFIAGSTFTFDLVKNLQLALISKYVSKQYLDNTSSDTRKLNAFFVNDFRLVYDLHLKGIKNLGFTVLVNNLFNTRYEANGYTYGYIYGGERIDENFYFPQAGINMLAGINLKF